MKRIILFATVLALVIFVSCKKEADPAPTGPVYTKPVVTTAPVTSFSPGFAFGGGTVISDGGDYVSTRGVAWSTKPNEIFGMCFQTQDGILTGTFVSKMTILPNTTYYVRAYAVNRQNHYGFGQERSLTAP